MGTKLEKSEITKLKGIGISASDKEEARKEMIKFLAGHDIEGVDDDSFEELYSMCEVLYADSDEEMAAAAKEVSEKPKKKAKKVEEVQDDEDESDEDEEEEEEVQPKKKAKKVEEPKKKAKKVVEPEVDEEEEEEVVQPKKAKKEKVERTKKVRKTTKKIDPVHSEEDQSMFDSFKKKISKLLKGHEIQFDFLIKSGIVVRLVGENSKRVLFCFNSLKYNDSGEIVGKFYFPTVRNEELLEEIFGEDIEIFEDWSGKLKIKNMPLSEIAGALENSLEIVENIISSINKKDEKLGKNRKKMEEDLKNNKKSKVEEIKSKSKKAKKVEEPEEEEEEEEVQPKKAAKKKK